MLQKLEISDSEGYPTVSWSCRLYAAACHAVDRVKKQGVLSPRSLSSSFWLFRAVFDVATANTFCSVKLLMLTSVGEYFFQQWLSSIDLSPWTLRFLNTFRNVNCREAFKLRLDF